MKNSNSITNGVIWKTLLAFFFPVLLSTFFQQMYNTVDAMVVGRFVGKEALAAVGGTTSGIINLIVGFFMGLASGATVILAQFYGAKNREDAGRTVHTAAAFALIGGAVIMIAGVAFSPAILRWLDTPEDVLPHAITYITIYFAGMIPSLIYNIGSGLLRAVGDSRRPLIYLIIACAVHAVLDVILVGFLGMGVSGAAWSTVITQTLSAILVIRCMIRTKDLYHLDVKRIRIHGDLLRDIVRIGLPAGVQSVLYSVSTILIQAAVNSFGTDVAAAYTAYNKLDVFYWMFTNAFAISITTFAGQNFGAQQYGRMKKGTRTCLAMSIAATTLLSLVFVLFSRVLYSLFTADARVIEIGVEMLKLMVPLYALYGVIEIIAGALRSVGDALVPTVITFFTLCLVRVVWVLCVVPKHHTIPTLLACFPITWVLTSLILVIYYLFSGWLKRAIRRSGAEVPA